MRLAFDEEAKMGSRRAPTMKDVAKLAGVSQPTVSYVLNGTASVSEDVTNKVMDAIRQLGYVPNALAQSLKNQQTWTVGLIIPDIDSGYYGEVVKTIEVKLRSQGYITFLCNSFYSPDLERQYVNALVKQNVAGIIVGYGLADQSAYKDLQNLDLPVVVIDDKTDYPSQRIPSIEINNVNGSCLAVEHLLSVGARNICFASEPLFNRTLAIRYKGFVSAMEKNHCTINEKNILIENNQYSRIEMGYDLGARILLNKNIDAVFASSDTLAYGIIQRLKEHGVGVPEDIAVMGFDDIPLAKFMSPALTTISQPKHIMANRGVDLLMSRIRNEAIEDVEVMLEPSLIVRQSTMKNTRREVTR